MTRRRTSSHAVDHYLSVRPLLPLLTIADVAQLLKISRPTVYTLIDEGLPCIRFGKAVRFSPGSLQAFLTRREEIG